MTLGKRVSQAQEIENKKRTKLREKRKRGVKGSQCSISRVMVKEMVFARGGLNKCFRKGLVLFQWPWEGELNEGQLQLKD